MSPLQAQKWVQFGPCRGRDPFFRRLKRGGKSFAPGELRPHISHRMVSQGRTFWCATCGYWGQSKLRELARPCKNLPQDERALSHIAKGKAPHHRGSSDTLDPDETIYWPKGMENAGIAERPTPAKQDYFNERTFDWESIIELSTVVSFAVSWLERCAQHRVSPKQ